MRTRKMLRAFLKTCRAVQLLHASVVKFKVSGTVVYCVVAASRGASNSRSDSLVVSSRVEQASEPICLEYQVVVECSPLAVIVLETGYIEFHHFS